MATVTRPAVRIEQGKLTLFLTYVTPRDLTTKNFYQVDKLEPATDGSGKGFQRILNDGRANRLARHLREAFPEGYANLPTTIFLATEKALDFNTRSNTLSFDPETVGPFSVVDGQHRIEGIIKASKENNKLLDFQLPATIAPMLDDTHQMYHFYIVNTTQQAVEIGLQQQIISRFTDMKGIDDLPYLPFWFQRQVELGSDAQALRLVEFLNTSDDSPLKGRIRMANDSERRGRINQSGLVNILKSNVFHGTNPISLKEPDITRVNKIMLNYFNAIDHLLVSDGGRETTIVYKNNGLFFFLSISKWVFTSIYASGKSFTVESISETLQQAFGNLEYEYQAIANREWWMPGGSSISASGLNRATATLYANAFLRALSRSESDNNLL